MESRVDLILNSKSIIGKKLYLLGTAENGPVNIPVKASSISHVISTFGRKGSLVSAYKSIIESKLDCEIYLCKVTGTHAEVFLNVLNNDELLENAIQIKSKYANEKYNNIDVILSPDALYIEYGYQELKERKIHKYDFNSHKTLFHLAEAINSDARALNGDVFCYLNVDHSIPTVGSIDSVNPTISTLSGGDSGLYYGKNMYYTSLEETYLSLEGTEVDVISPLEANFDDTYTFDKDDLELYYNDKQDYLTLTRDGRYCSYYSQLLDFCQKQMRNGFITHGVIGMSYEKSSDIDYLIALKYFKRINYVKKSKSEHESLISVVIGKAYCLMGISLLSLSALYASLIASIPIAKNTTNMPLPSSVSLSSSLTEDELNSISDIGYTVFRYSHFKKTVVVKNGVTCSKDDSLKYLVNSRMLQLAMSYVRGLLSLYIGSEISNKSLELFNSDLKSLLDSIVNLDIISGYNIRQLTNKDDGYMLLELMLKTKYMIEYVSTYSGLKNTIL